jgi:hypothetical protein
LGTVVAMFSYFSYAAAFVQPEGAERAIDGSLVAVALAIAPFVFVVVALVSRNPRAPRMVLLSMGLLLALGLALGLVSPVLGAAAGFGVGAALCLRLPDIPGQMTRRIIAVALAISYTTVLLLVATPAGVLSGAIVPILMIGFADEYGAWRWAQAGAKDEAGG